MVDEKHSHEDGSADRIFENSAEALFSVVQMQDRIREQGLDLKSAMDWVAVRTLELTGSSGVAVGLVQQDAVVFPARVGIAVTMAGLPSQANLFQSCIHNGGVVPVPDAQNDPGVGSSCRREGVRSLIVVPISRHQETAGAMGIFFKETRSFSNADVMSSSQTLSANSWRSSRKLTRGSEHSPPPTGPRLMKISIRKATRRSAVSHGPISPNMQIRGPL
jgi:LytS/YehU family sensor histidine kinase